MNELLKNNHALINSVSTFQSRCRFHDGAVMLFIKKKKQNKTKLLRFQFIFFISKKKKKAQRRVQIIYAKASQQIEYN